VPSVSAIILAAGESTRMGTQKALLPWQGTTLIEYELAQLASIDAITEIVVVTGHEPTRIEEMAGRAPRTRIARNDNYRSGKVSSIKTGVAASTARADAIALFAVDQPRPASIVQRLLDAHFAANALITLPSHGGHRGHPVIFDTALRDELAALREDMQGIREVLRRREAEINVIDFDDPAVLLDLNTPHDLTANEPGSP
jgi:molybdenum cofactor cytidylyltransferase